MPTNVDFMGSLLQEFSLNVTYETVDFMSLFLNLMFQWFYLSRCLVYLVVTYLNEGILMAFGYLRCVAITQKYYPKYAMHFATGNQVLSPRQLHAVLLIAIIENRLRVG